MNRVKALQMLQKPASKSRPSDQVKTDASSNHPTAIINNQSTQPPEADGIHCQNSTPIERDLDEEVLASFDNWDPMGEDYHSTDNTLHLDPDKEPECVITGHMTEEFAMVGKHRVCDFYLKHGSCADGEYCSRLHVRPEARDRLRALQMTNATAVTKTCLFYHSLSPVELKPNADTLMLVSITSIEAPNKFHFIAPYEQMNFAGFNDDEIKFYIGRVQHSSTFKTKLQKCHEQLALLFDHNYRVDNIKDHVFLNQIVACKLPNGRFYRGAVIEKLDDDEYKIHLIDVGREITLFRTDIYTIRASCLNEPPMSIMASLRVKPPLGNLKWSAEALDAFDRLATNQKYLLCRVLSLEMDDVFTVDLLNIENRSSLSSELIASKFAEPTFSS